MSETVNYFEQLEKDMADIEVPQFPDDNMEAYITKAIDPIVGAQLIQHYIETQSPDAQEQLMRKYLDILNYQFMGTHMNRQTDIMIENIDELPGYGQVFDMQNLLVELNDKGEARVGGKMYYFEKHFYTNEQTGVKRPIVSLRLHSSAFMRQNNTGGQVVGIENYATIPVTSIVDYRIKED